MNKIAILCNYELLPERIGGMDYFFWEFDQKCKENGIQVDWFFPNKASHGHYETLTIIDCGRNGVATYFVQHTKEKQYSHVITHFVELCTPIFKVIKQQSNCKIIAVDHNPRPLGGYPLKKKVTKKIKGILYSKYVDLFVGVSQYTINEIWKDFGNHLKAKSVVIYNGVIINDILERKERKSEIPIFLVASHLRESKGIQDLIEAVSLLPRNIKKHITVDVYGDGPYQEFLLAKAERQGVSHCFCFKGSVANLKEIYHQYDYMLQPTHMECFSLSILESLAANVPVVTTNVGGNEEVIMDGENGFIYDATDIKALNEIILNLYTRKLSITLNTRELIETNFSLRQMVDNHFKLLTK